MISTTERDEQLVMRFVTRAALRWEKNEPGVVRLYDLTGPLVGEIVLRDGDITYAELRGRIFPFWPADNHDHERDRLLNALHPQTENDRLYIAGLISEREYRLGRGERPTDIPPETK